VSGAWMIFEGPDGAGKTGLAAAAATIMADPRTPGGAPTVLHHLTSESEFDEYVLPRLWRLKGLNVVQDRCLLSDLVYAPVWMGVPSRLGEARVRAELVRQAPHAVVFHVTASEGVLLERMRERNDIRENADPGEGQMHALLKNYWREVSWWADAGATIVEVDTTEGDFPAGVELEMLLSVGIERLARGVR
jgi:thymidylate kinase